jgi:TfoX/Sxy family transcriptional regulator of competence genes
MAYDEHLAQRVQACLEDVPNIESRKMFGGVAYMYQGHMLCGVVGEQLMVRVGPENYEQALCDPLVKPMDFTGKPLKGMVYVMPTALRDEDGLSAWVQQGLKFAQSLPAKKKRKKP